MKIYRIAAIPGDGIGKEVIPAGQKVLEALAAAGKSFAFEFENFGWGGDYYRQHGVMMPDDGLDRPARQGRHPVRVGRRPTHSRSHHPVGPAAQDLPGIRPVCQRPPDAPAAGHRKPVEALPDGGPRLGHRPRKLRRRVLGCRRTGASGTSHRNRDRRLDPDPRRRRAHPPLRLPARAVAPAQAARP